MRTVQVRDTINKLPLSKQSVYLSVFAILKHRLLGI